MFTLRILHFLVTDKEVWHLRDLSETTSNELMKKSRYVVFNKKEMERKFIGTSINEGGTVGGVVWKPLLPSEK